MNASNKDRAINGKRFSISATEIKIPIIVRTKNKDLYGLFATWILILKG